MVIIKIGSFCGECNGELSTRYDEEKNILFIESCLSCKKKYFGSGFNSGYEKGQEDLTGSDNSRGKMKSDFMVVQDEAKEIFRISWDGKVTLGKDVTLDEASKKFWVIIQEQAESIDLIGKYTEYFITKEKLILAVKEVIKNSEGNTIIALARVSFLKDAFFLMFKLLGLPITEEDL